MTLSGPTRRGTLWPEPSVPLALKSSRGTDVKWCQPRLVVRVKHLAGSKTLRHATVKRLET